MFFSISANLSPLAVSHCSQPADSAGGDIVGTDDRDTAHTVTSRLGWGWGLLGHAATLQATASRNYCVFNFLNLSKR